MTAAREDARAQAADAAPRSSLAARRFALAAFALLACVGFLALGTWQVQRLHWKLDLIARVNMRVRAPAVPAPPPSAWRAVSREKDEYRHVSVTGRFLYGRETRVQATTELGSGYWLLTPLRQADGSIVLVNRGFVPADTPVTHAGLAVESAEPVTVNGLLRMPEPGGGFLRHNAPAQDRWYSRDVAAIAQARGLGRMAAAGDAGGSATAPAVNPGKTAGSGATGVAASRTAASGTVASGTAASGTQEADVAPFFIDADAGQPQVARPAPGASVSPVGGLTVIRFPNNHLSYALTWYALALMAAGATWWVATDGRRRKAATADAAAESSPR